MNLYLSGMYICFYGKMTAINTRCKTVHVFCKQYANCEMLWQRQDVVRFWRVILRGPHHPVHANKTRYLQDGIVRFGFLDDPST